MDSAIKCEQQKQANQQEKYCEIILFSSIFVFNNTSVNISLSTTSPTYPPIQPFRFPAKLKIK